MGVRSQKWSQDNLRGKEHKIESPGRAKIRLECGLACVSRFASLCFVDTLVPEGRAPMAAGL